MNTGANEHNRNDRFRHRAEAILARRLDGEELHQSVEDVAELLHELQVHEVKLEMQNEELQKSRLAVEQSRNEYARLYDLAPVGYFSLDPYGIIQRVNLTGSQLLGYERHFLIGKRFLNFVAPRHRENFYQLFRQILEQGDKQIDEWQLIGKATHSLWALVEGVAATDEQDVMHCLITVTDVTKRKSYESQLLESRHLVAQVAEAIPDVLYVDDIVHNRNLYINRNAFIQLGYPPKDTDGSGDFFARLLHPEDQPKYFNRQEQLARLSDGEIYEETYRFRHRDGSWRWYVSRNVVFQRDEAGLPTQVLGISQDITEKLAAQQRDRQQRELIASITEHSVNGIYAFDDQLRFTAWNQVMTRHTGFAASQIIGKPMADIGSDFRQHAQMQATHRVLQGEAVTLHERPYGFPVGVYEINLIPLHDANVVVGGVCLIHDLTERMQAEEVRASERRQQQRMILDVVLQAQQEERKRIAEALHNGLGQLLYATKLNVEQLNLQQREVNIPHLKEVKRNLNTMLDEAIRETRHLSHELVPHTLENFGLRAALQDLVRKIPAQTLSVTYQYDLKERPERLMELAIFRIAQELLSNVMKHAEATEVSIRLTQGAQQIVMLVTDNGKGFRVRSAGKNGLGLKTIRNRVELITGTLAIRSQLGKGSSVTVKIPL